MEMETFGLAQIGLLGFSALVVAIAGLVAKEWWTQMRRDRYRATFVLCIAVQLGMLLLVLPRASDLSPELAAIINPLVLLVLTGQCACMLLTLMTGRRLTDQGIEAERRRAS
jgi:hypothetical protein